VCPLAKRRKENLSASGVISKIKVVSGQSLPPKHPDLYFVPLKINVGHIKNVVLYTAKFSFFQKKNDFLVSPFINKVCIFYRTLS
jgi:hypothetical protein